MLSVYGLWSSQDCTMNGAIAAEGCLAKLLRYICVQVEVLLPSQMFFLRERPT
jgi:hypothetical protein